MSADSEQLLPPNEPTAFESLCLDLWKDIWGDPGAQKNGRSGQPQAGVDLFGQMDGKWIGVQCKQKDGLLWSKVNIKELEREVAEALSFKPKLNVFILATSGPTDVKVQQRARELTEKHQKVGLFDVEVWSWEKIWHEIFGRGELLRKVGPIYWPRHWRVIEDEFKERFEDSQQKFWKPKVAPSRLPYIADSLIGRAAELKRLEKAWNDKEQHILVIRGIGGEGKTSLAVQWAAELAKRDFDGASFFDWSFQYGRRGHLDGEELPSFIDTALEFFEENGSLGDADTRWAKGAQLAQLIGNRRTLLIIDGLEEEQQPPGILRGELKDSAMVALLRGLAQHNEGLCVITTREPIRELMSINGARASELVLGPLSTEDSSALLNTLGVVGPKPDIEKLILDVKGHALTLNLIGRFLKRACQGDIRKKYLVDFEKADTGVDGKAFAAIEAYVKWFAAGDERSKQQLAILELLGLFDRPAEMCALSALREPPAIANITDAIIGLTDLEWHDRITSLIECGLLFDDATTASANSRKLDSHSLIRQYFSRQLKKQEAKSWRKAHQRIYKGLLKAAPHLEGAEYVYAGFRAIQHGCLANMPKRSFWSIYWNIVEARNGTEKLRFDNLEISALASFFETLWSVPLSGLGKGETFVVSREAALCLSRLGRYEEASQLSAVATKRLIQLKNWWGAVEFCTIWADAEIMLGNIDAALRNIRQAEDCFDRINFIKECLRDLLNLRFSYAMHDFRHVVGRSCEFCGPHRREIGMCLANALLEGGKIDQANEQFSRLPRMRWGVCEVYSGEEWECAMPEPIGQMEAKLFPVEIKVWRLFLQRACPGRLLAFDKELEENVSITPLLKCCRDIENQILKAHNFIARFEPEHTSRPLQLSDCHAIMLPRLELYRRVLTGVADCCLCDWEARIDALQSYGDAPTIIRALLTRAWLRMLDGNSGGASTDLNSAYEIGQRGPMRLFIADVNLCRARLFHDKSELKLARNLIEYCGYWRRKQELEDAERAAETW
jgi:tetratricopeptide (TPR) repeat protein/Mrp family chromosome partitioning ATPase